jgi:hypothetical protein
VIRKKGDRDPFCPSYTVGTVAAIEREYTVIRLQPPYYLMLEANENWITDYELESKDSKVRNVYYEYNITYYALEENYDKELFKPVINLFFNVLGCGKYVYDVVATQNDTLHTKSYTFPSPFTGTIIYCAAHLHIHAANATVSIDNKPFCTSNAIYVDGDPFIHEVSKCIVRQRVVAGQSFTIESVYFNHNVKDAMGMMNCYIHIEN